MPQEFDATRSRESQAHPVRTLCSWSEPKSPVTGRVVCGTALPSGAQRRALAAMAHVHPCHDRPDHSGDAKRHNVGGCASRGVRQLRASPGPSIPFRLLTQVVVVCATYAWLWAVESASIVRSLTSASPDVRRIRRATIGCIRRSTVPRGSPQRYRNRVPFGTSSRS